MSTSTDLVQHNLDGQHFGYSAADLTDLGSTEYTIVNIIVDESGSVSPFKKEMEECIKNAIGACKKSPRSDYLLMRLLAFNREMREIHGFKELINCELSSYDDCLNPRATTLLYDTVTNAINATNDYSTQLSENDYDVNAIIIIITDGMDNESIGTIIDVKESLKKVVSLESLESILTILVGVGVGHYSEVSGELNKFKDEAELNQYIEIENSDADSLAKLADFVSKSISSQSQALGTGSVSQPLLF